MTQHEIPHYRDNDPFTHASNFLLANGDIISDTGAAQVAQLHLLDDGELIDSAVSTETPTRHVILDVQDADDKPSKARWVVTVADAQRGRTQTEITMQDGQPHAVEYDLGHQRQLIKYTELSDDAAASSLEFVRTILENPATTARIDELRATHTSILRTIADLNNQQAALHRSKEALVGTDQSHAQADIDKIDTAIRKLEAHEQAVFDSQFLPPSMVHSLRDVVPRVGDISYDGSHAKPSFS